jgi:hypothetical protein
MVVWIAAVFSEFMGPFNVLHQPLYLSVVAWAFWAVPAIASAAAIVTVIERPPRHAVPGDGGHDAPRAVAEFPQRR